jgi:Icc-related predicted phosphoesterase
MCHGLQPVIDLLADVRIPVVLVPGNGESDAELREACREYPNLHVLHGEGTVIDGMDFYGLGAGVPVTPFGAWSFDLTEEEAARLLADCPPGGVLVSHSPPFGHCDRDGEGHRLGSQAVLEAMEAAGPRLLVCGHVHASWGCEAHVGGTRIVNAGPRPRMVTL